jgi:hypothetical protein
LGRQKARERLVGCPEKALSRQEIVVAPVDGAQAVGKQGRVRTDDLLEGARVAGRGKFLGDANLLGS